MNPQQAKTEFYQMFGYKPAWNAYVQSLSERDAFDTWSKKPPTPIVNKPLPKPLKKHLIKTTVNFISREVHRVMP